MNSVVPFFFVCVGIIAARAEVTFSSGPTQVALVELYTSEGCSSCPPAEKWLGDLGHDAGLWRRFVPIAFHVNYWDHLGWRDVLASKEFTQRQYAYADSWHAPNVYTPCVVRSGSEWSWRDKASVDGEVRAAGNLVVTRSDSGECRVTYTPPTGRRREDLTISVALLGSGIISKVKAGENSGRELRHEFVAMKVATSAMTREGDGSYSCTLTLQLPPERQGPAFKRLALAAWVAPRNALAPIQAVGGWLN